MTVFTKINGLKVLLLSLSALLLFHVFLNYVDFNTGTVSSYNKLSYRKIHKYGRVPIENQSEIIPTLANGNEQRFESNLTVIYTNTSPHLILSNTTISQDLQVQSMQVTKRTISNKNANNRSSNVSINNNNNINNNKKFEEKHIPHNSSKIPFGNLPMCVFPDTENEAPVTPNTTLESLDVVENELKSLLKPGGAYEPEDCKPKDHVAIIVAFRDRYAHLSIFLRNIHPFLMKQRIAYRIFLIEQTNGKPFNRAAMMNIGFLEALKVYPWDCFIFHDVDLLPLDHRNLYNCPRQPRHMSVAIDKFQFQLPYLTLFGGVSAMTRKHFEAVNGYSNSFFGWGGEDDDMFNRIKHANLYISRYTVNIARYMMLKHQKEKANPLRYERLMNGISKIEMDGLNSIKYNIYSMIEHPTYTWYLAELKTSDQKS